VNNLLLIVNSNNVSELCVGRDYLNFILLLDVKS
jgi:hypothetical protein